MTKITRNNDRKVWVNAVQTYMPLQNERREHLRSLSKRFSKLAAATPCDQIQCDGVQCDGTQCNGTHSPLPVRGQSLTWDGLIRETSLISNTGEGGSYHDIKEDQQIVNGCLRSSDFSRKSFESVRSRSDSELNLQMSSSENIKDYSEYTNEMSGPENKTQSVRTLSQSHANDSISTDNNSQDQIDDYTAKVFSSPKSSISPNHDNCPVRDHGQDQIIVDSDNASSTSSSPGLKDYRWQDSTAAFVSLDTPGAGACPTFSRTTLRYSMKSHEYLLAGGNSSCSSSSREEHSSAEANHPKVRYEDSNPQTRPKRHSSPVGGMEHSYSNKMSTRSTASRTPFFSPRTVQDDDEFPRSKSQEQNFTDDEAHYMASGYPEKGRPHTEGDTAQVKLARFGNFGNACDVSDQSASLFTFRHFSSRPVPARSILKRDSLARQSQSEIFSSDDDNVESRKGSQPIEISNGRHTDQSASSARPSLITSTFEDPKAQKVSIEPNGSINREYRHFLQRIGQAIVPRSYSQILRDQNNTCASCERLIGLPSTNLAAMFKRASIGRRNSRTFDRKRTANSSGKSRWQNVPPADESRYCWLSGKLFCRACHQNHTSVIPYNVISTWDFTEKPVSKIYKELVTVYEGTPLVHYRHIHPVIKKTIPELTTIRNARRDVVPIRQLFEGQDHRLPPCRAYGSYDSRVLSSRNSSCCSDALQVYEHKIGDLVNVFRNKQYWFHCCDLFSLNDLKIVKEYSKQRQQTSWFSSFSSLMRWKSFFSCGDTNASTDTPRSYMPTGENTDSVKNGAAIVDQFLEFVNYWKQHIIECAICGTAFVDMIEEKKSWPKASQILPNYKSFFECMEK